MILPSLLLSGAGILGLSSATVVAECLASLLPKSPTAPSAEKTGKSARPKVAVLVPAHDEEQGISATIASLKQALDSTDRILVVADNCKDRTAQVAREAGAEVVEREDSANRGKGFALSFGFGHLAENPPDVVIIVDADCSVAPDSLKQLAEAAFLLNRPAQSDYLLEAAEAGDAKSAISAFALLVRNRVRPRGLGRLGLPCQLTGSGMAFPYAVLKEARPTGSHVVEDLIMGLDLTERGFPPLFVETAKVRSRLPDHPGAQATQRKRWETGQLSTLLQVAPGLLVRGLAKRKPGLISSALDLAVPPLAMHVALLSGGAVAAALLVSPASLASVAFGVQLAGIGGALGVIWWREGREVLPLKKALAIPGYVMWKVPVYLSFLVRGREQNWVRTQR